MYYILLTVLAAACAVACYALAAARRRVRETADRAASAEARAQTAETRLVELTERLRTTDLDLVAARKDADALRGRLEEEEGKLREKNAMLMLQFEKTAEEIFERKSRQFRETNRESLDLVLKPLKDNISDFKRRVEEIYSQENVQRGTLKAELNNLMELNRRITEETNNLTTALRGNSKLQGDWGETILETLLESSDLQRGLHYTTQTNVKDAEGNNLRPDVILKLPDGKRVVIDSKVSLTAYVNYTSAIDEESRRRALNDHLRSVRNHVNELGRKSYQDNVLGSPDFVVMFIPTEPAFLDAVHADPELADQPLRHPQGGGRPLEARRPGAQRQPHRQGGSHDVRQVCRFRLHAGDHRQGHRHAARQLREGHETAQHRHGQPGQPRPAARGAERQDLPVAAQDAHRRGRRHPRRGVAPLRQTNRLFAPKDPVSIFFRTFV